MRSRRKCVAVALAISVIAAAGCSDQPTGPDRAALAVTPFSDALLSPQWQQRARNLVAALSPTPVAAGRTYAALSVAQFRAIVAVDEQVENTPPGGGFGAGGRNRYEAERGAVSGASVQVLSFLYPGAAVTLEQQVSADANAGPGGVHPAFTRGLAIGRAVGDAMIDQLKTDGSSVPWSGTIPVGPGLWTSSGAAPVGANLGGVRPYLLTSTAQFRPAPPPAFGSPAFQTDLNEVLTFSQNRTAQQIALAFFWAFLGPTPTPLGYWNQLAATYVEQADLSERAATHVFALMHAAQFDAQLACFEAKYHYFTIRPSQANPAITLTFALPNHPSYPSGHSCISSSAARVLREFFPDRASELANLVTDAGLSRMYAGIHYRFDINAGKELGLTVAEWAISNQQQLAPSPGLSVLTSPQKLFTQHTADPQPWIRLPGTRMVSGRVQL